MQNMLVQIQKKHISFIFFDVSFQINSIYHLNICRASTDAKIKKNMLQMKPKLQISLISYDMQFKYTVDVPSKIILKYVSRFTGLF